VGSYTVHGTVTDNGGSYTPAPTTGTAAVPDPIAAEITAGTITTPTQPATSSTCCSIQLVAPQRCQPGYYSSGINFNGSGYTVTLNPGVYYMGGEHGGRRGERSMELERDHLYGKWVSSTMNSASTMNLSAPSTGSTAGMVIWQPASNDSSPMNLDSSSSSSWGGAVYVPGAQLTLNGGSTAVGYGMIVVAITDDELSHFP
jgi:hypothetical protein